MRLLNKWRRQWRIRDQHGREWFTWDRWALRVLGFCLEWTEGSVYGIIIGWDSEWLSRQEKQKRCSKCKVFVPSPCAYNGVESWHEGGMWSNWCYDIWHPLPEYLGRQSRHHAAEL